MAIFHRWTETALLAGLLLAPLGAADSLTDHASDTGRDHRADQVQHGEKEHPNWPKICACENDQDRDALRDRIKALSEKDRGEFLDKLRDFMEERRARLDHLCELIKQHPHLSEERKQALLAIINERREEIRERMKEFCENRKAAYQHRVDLVKLSDKIDDLRSFLRSHPCLNADQKDRLQKRLADLKEDRQDTAQAWKDEHPDAAKRDGGDGNGGSAINDDQKQALAARMAQMKQQHSETRQDIRNDVGDIKEDRQDIHADRAALRQDHQDLKEDKARHDNDAVKADLHDIKDDRKDLHQDRKDLAADHQDLRQDLKDAGRPGLNDEQKARLKARMDQAREQRGDGADVEGGDHGPLSDEQRAKIKARMDQARDHRSDGATDGDDGDKAQLSDDQKAKLKARMDQARDSRPAQRGNNGLGNGEDPQPRGDPKLNDGAGAVPGRPGVRPAK